MILALDIETVPQPGIMDTWYPNWMLEKHPDDNPEEFEGMAALYPEFGMACAVSLVKIAGRDLETEVVAEYTAATLEDEGKMLGDLAARLSRHTVIFVGHNIKGFDIPFLAKRCLAHRIKVPDALSMIGKKPWGIPHRGTMELMRFGGGPSMSLRSACFMLGLHDPKEECNGAMVWDKFKEGRMNEISSYCTRDALAAAEVWRALVNGTDLVI